MISLDGFKLGGVVLTPSVSAGSTQVWTSPTSSPGSIIATTYTKVKEIKTNYSGSLRISFGFYMNSTSGTGYYRVYVNNVAVGVEHSSNSISWVNFSDDITVNQNDLIEIYCKSSNSAYTMYLGSPAQSPLAVSISPNNIITNVM